jgi:hypothetical protein
MKTLLALVLVFSLITSNLFAAVSTWQFCTADNKTIQTTVTISDDKIMLNPKLPAYIVEALEITSGKLSAEDLAEYDPGYLTFIHTLLELSEDAANAIEFITAPRVIADTCQVK